ncbi:alpha/beta hydrolase [Burkholderia latens]|nr:alpha/beta hydrolase [Burkholderia latens]
MRPILFGECFGWLHPGSGTRGVVLCSAYGHEAVWSHGGMRELADRLSAHGIPVLRFDYRGTGDSAGGDGASDQFDTAVVDVVAAIGRLREETGVTHVTLCGLRLGAAFMLIAAGQVDVDELVMLAPVVNGRSYLRELSMVRTIWLEQLPAPLRAVQQRDALLNVLGQVYSATFRDRLKRFDAAAVLKAGTRAPAARTLVFDVHPADSEPMCACIRALGGQAESRTFDGYGAFMQESVFSKLPERVFAAVVDWISAPIGAQPAAGVAAHTAADWPDLGPGGVLRMADVHERPVRFGADGLFGILCVPASSPDPDSAVLITNTSASPHVGDSRLSVRIAREIARRGIASLRFDARGIGDGAVSRAMAARMALQPVYSKTTVEDAAAAADWLKACGYRNVVSFGICSGAYSALRAGLLGRSLSGVVSVNLQSFYIPEGVSVESLHQYQSNSLAGYRSSFFDLSKWVQVLRGERRIWPFVRLMLRRTWTLLSNRVAAARRRGARPPAADAVPTDPHEVMRALQRNGVSTLFVCGAYDSSLDLMTMHFGRRGKRLERFRSARAAVLDEVDHSVFGGQAVDKVVELCVEFTQQLGAAQAPVGKPAGRELRGRYRRPQVPT